MSSQMGQGGELNWPRGVGHCGWKVGKAKRAVELDINMNEMVKD